MSAAAGGRQRALPQIPLGVILRHTFDRPWLSLYRDRPPSQSEEERIRAEQGCLALAPGEEVWLQICKSVGFLDLGRLAMVCTMLQRVTSSPDLWEARCLRAWKLSGWQACRDVLYVFNWSWRRMGTRPRLRTDGVYWLELTAYTHGIYEGRGMKEVGRDFYKGKCVPSSYWRYLRFLPDGRLCTHLTWRPPLVAAPLFAKATGTRHGAEAALRRLGGALFGSYEVLADDARGLVRLRGMVVVALEQFPRMRPATVHYELTLGASGRGASNSLLAVVSHYSSYLPDGSDVLEHAVPSNGHLSFVSFDAARRAGAADGGGGGGGGGGGPPPLATAEASLAAQLESESIRAE